MKKYQLIKEENTNLLRIKYLIDIPRFGIKVGDLGGLLESENNLSHKGDCVVLENARVFGNAWVYGNAWVFGTARVYGNAEVFGKARASDNARIYGDARVHNNAWVSGNAVVSGDASVSGTAVVSGTAMVSNNSKIKYSNITSTVIGIQGSKDYINLDGEYIHIGCQGHKIDYWLENYESIGKDNNYSEAEIKEYGEYLDTLSGKSRISN